MTEQDLTQRLETLERRIEKLEQSTTDEAIAASLMRTIDKEQKSEKEFSYDY